MDLSRLAVAVALTALVSLPLAATLWALLDAARRPQWAWALAGRSQVVWLTWILFASLTLVLGIFVSAWYLSKVRPLIAAAEEGRIEPGP